VRLVRAELARLSARRFTRIGLLGLLVVIGLITVGIAASAHKPTEADRVKAHADAQRYRAEAQIQYENCRQGMDAAGPSASPAATAGPGSKPLPPNSDCSDIIAHQPTDEDLLPHTFTLVRDAPELYRALGALLALFGFAVGASFIGAEWSSGGVMTLLVWRPRRAALWLGKLASLLLGVLGVGVVLSTLWYAAMWVIATQRGITAGLTPGALTSLALTDARSVGIGLAAAVVGYSIAFLGRNTATALGAAIGWVVIFEIGGRIVAAITQAVRPERWYLSSYLLAWLEKEARFEDFARCRDVVDASCSPVEWSITLRQATPVLGVGMLLVALISLVIFRRRDVT